MQKFLVTLKAFYNKNKRDLPWRKTHDPYKILVSEIMLQQTQAGRVAPFYINFLKQFPTAQQLAHAPLSQVLKAWQGLGYNRRAKFLHEAAKQIVALKKFPTKVEEIEKLRGVGHYTARAIVAFAFNKPEVFIETNIRTVFIYHFARGLTSGRIEDKDILPLVERALKESKMQPRDFYAALMDYGAYLKGQGVKLNSKSKHYNKQSKFEGSTRQLRGAIVRELLKKPQTLTQLTKNLSRKSEEVHKELKRLLREQLISRRSKEFFVE